MRGHPWTAEEDSKARELLAHGPSWKFIGKLLGRSADSVRQRFRGAAEPPAPQAPPSMESVAHSVQSPAPVQIESRAPAVHTSKSRAESYLLISDLQIPYHHPRALEFCKKVRFEFGVPLENVLCVGDEFDLHAFSRFEKSPDAPHTANQEIDACRAEIARWGAAFPKVRICRSNHGNRLQRAAARAGIPSRALEPYRDLFGVPEGWQYAEHWVIKASKQSFRLEHGHWKPGGHAGLRTRPLFRGMSVAFGHEHAEPATIHVDTYGLSVWSMRVGSLITQEPVPAFEYNTEDSYRPTASVGVVLDGGRLPLIVRM